MVLLFVGLLISIRMDTTDQTDLILFVMSWCDRRVIPISHDDVHSCLCHQLEPSPPPHSLNMGFDVENMALEVALVYMWLLYPLRKPAVRVKKSTQQENIILSTWVSRGSFHFCSGRPPDWELNCIKTSVPVFLQTSN